MASPETDTMKGMLQTLESVITTRTRCRLASLLGSQRSGKPLASQTSPTTSAKLDELAKQRA